MDELLTYEVTIRDRADRAELATFKVRASSAADAVERAARKHFLGGPTAARRTFAWARDEVLVSVDGGARYAPERRVERGLLYRRVGRRAEWSAWSPTVTIEVRR